MTSRSPLPGRSLAELRPDVASEWHPTRNGSLTPDAVTVASNRKVWWLGRCGHEWDAPPTSRTTKNAGCPVCTGKRVVPGVNDLATLHPQLSIEWHPTRNGELHPNSVAAGSSKRVWWQAGCGHEWQVSIVDRVHHHSRCPYCHGNLRVLSGVNDLAARHPDLANEWHPTRNGDLRPEKVREFSMRKVWWLGQCGHEWTSTVAHRANGRGCPYCAGKRTLLDFNDLASTDPAIASEWHPTRNGDLTPQLVPRGSDQKVWWYSHGHEWHATISSRTISNQGCAVCRGLQIQIGVNDLQSQHPNLAAQWHPTKNGTLTPQMVSDGSKRLVWWIGECGHEWKASVIHRTSGRGCAVCRGLQIQIGVNDLQSQHPNLAAQWHPTKNGTLTPRMVTPSSGRKAWWMCEEGHQWEARIAGRQHGMIGCPECAETGYSPARDGWLYLLEHHDYGLQQIGITNNPAQRLKDHSSRGWTTLDIRGPMPGDLAQRLERQLLVALRSQGARLGDIGGQRKFSGYTESWPLTSFSSIRLKDLLADLDAD